MKAAQCEVVGCFLSFEEAVGDGVSEPFSRDRKPAADGYALLKSYHLPLRQMRLLLRSGRKHQFEWIAEVKKAVSN